MRDCNGWQVRITLVGVKGWYMRKKCILVVDDEEDILELVRYTLSKENYHIHTVTSGEEALRYARQKIPDMIVLDLMLPGVDGLEVCRILKKDDRFSQIPIVMLTAKGEDADIVSGLELGADDYITKPFTPRVLLARIKVVLRRYKKEAAKDENGIVKHHGIKIDPHRYQIFVGDQSIELTNSEFRVLHFLCRNPGRVFTRDQIINAVKGEDYPVTDRSVDVQLVGLRKKLGCAGKYIETIRGVGYRIKE